MNKFEHASELDFNHASELDFSETLTFSMHVH